MLWRTACLMMTVAALDAPAFQEVRETGTAVKLTTVLAETQIVADAAPIEDQVVLRTEDGRVIPLLSTAASRALFRDEALRDRLLEVQGRRYDSMPYLLVTSIRARENGEWRTPEYYCDVCTISVRDPQDCPCCQGPMELRFRPED